jgi:hypothetical protein
MEGRRRNRMGSGGGFRHDGSWPDRRWRHGIGPEGGDEGGAGQVGGKGRLGRMTGWAGFRNGK